MVSLPSPQNLLWTDEENSKSWCIFFLLPKVDLKTSSGLSSTQASLKEYIWLPKAITSDEAKSVFLFFFWLFSSLFNSQWFIFKAHNLFFFFPESGRGVKKHFYRVFLKTQQKSLMLAVKNISCPSIWKGLLASLTRTLVGPFEMSIWPSKKATRPLSYSKSNMTTRIF